MPGRRTPRPTNAELEILRVLWRRGPSTVREVHGELERDPPARYTTVLKLLQIMTEKGLVRRNSSQRTHVYRAAVSESATQRRLVTDLLDRAFDGSARDLVMHALSSKRASPKELEQIRLMLDELTGDEQ